MLYTWVRPETMAAGCSERTVCGALHWKLTCTGANSQWCKLQLARALLAAPASTHCSLHASYLQKYCQYAVGRLRPSSLSQWPVDSSTFLLPCTHASLRRPETPSAMGKLMATAATTAHWPPWPTHTTLTPALCGGGGGSNSRGILPPHQHHRAQGIIQSLLTTLSPIP